MLLERSISLAKKMQVAACSYVLEGVDNILRGVCGFGVTVMSHLARTRRFLLLCPAPADATSKQPHTNPSEQPGSTLLPLLLPPPPPLLLLSAMCWSLHGQHWDTGCCCCCRCCCQQDQYCLARCPGWLPLQQRWLV
jgi:hypothetical protein